VFVAIQLIISKLTHSLSRGAFCTFYFSEIFRDSLRISEKKAGAKREFYAASQIFSENIRDS